MVGIERTRSGKLVRKHNQATSTKKSKRRRIEPQIENLSDNDDELQSSSVEDVLFQQMSDVCSKTITIWRASRLLRLEHSSNRLKHAERKIQLELKSSTGLTFAVTIKSIDGIAERDNDGRSILILADEHYEDDNEGVLREHSKLQHCLCIFGCRSNSLNRWACPARKNGYLPVMVASGPVLLVKKLVEAVQTSFGCHVKPIRLAGTGIQLFTASWILKDLRDDPSGRFILRLIGVSKDNMVEVSMNFQDLIRRMGGNVEVAPTKVWKIILQSLDSQKVLYFDKNVQVHTVITKDMNANVNGRIKLKLKSLEDVYNFWRDLTKLSEAYI